MFRPLGLFRRRAAGRQSVKMVRFSVKAIAAVRRRIPIFATGKGRQPGPGRASRIARLRQGGVEAWPKQKTETMKKAMTFIAASLMLAASCTARQGAPKALADVEYADLAQLAKAKYQIPKYAVKMATGTGKTWVMHALLLWQLLNARHEEEPSGRYTQNFLIVAPGLIVYDRLKDAYRGRMKENSGERDLFTNDLYLHKDLFVPPAYQDEVFSFIQNNVVTKEEGIGRKVTGNGLIALTNWHLFLSDEDEEETDTDSPSAIIKEILPIRPGTSGGNALDALDRQYLRGSELEYLADLPDLMVINDEAHHIHENKIQGEIEEVEWQKGLNRIAQRKGEHFFQIDFSATPYDTVGSGKRKAKHYFPHIVTDFDLGTAMRMGLVKTLLLDRRQELTDLGNLDYNAVREGRKVIALSDGQRLMLRAGLRKLQILPAKRTSFC